MAHLSSTLLARITLDMKEKPRRTIDESIASFVAAVLEMWDHFLFGVAERPPNARLRVVHISKFDPFLGACDEPGVRKSIKRPIHACHPLKYREALMDPETAKVVQSQAYLDFVLENEAQVDQRSAAILSEAFKSLRQDQLSEQKLAMAIEAYRVSKDRVNPLVRRVCQAELLSASALCHDDLSERMNSLNPAERRIIVSNIERVAAGLQYINDDLNQEAADLALEESFYLIAVILRSRCRNSVAGWNALVAEISD